MPDLRAAQFDDGISYRIEHFSDLLIVSFVQNYFKPRIFARRFHFLDFGGARF